MNKPVRRPRAVLAVLLLIAGNAGADGEILLYPDDTGLRDDILLLSDAGLLSMPVGGWPLSAVALREEMDRVAVPPGYRAEIRGAWHRLSSRLDSSNRVTLETAVTDETVALRRFGYQPRGTGVTGTVSGRHDRLSLRLSLTLQERTRVDRRRARLDGSYVGWRAGSWLLSAGQVPRWWGPGRESSLVLSTNARPVPGIALDTIRPIRFESPWLSWMGATDWKIFAGRMESGRSVAGARLLGLRFGLRPHPRLEIAFSRSAQWGGEGRPEDIGSLLKLLAGRDNRDDDGISIDNEPGNQLGGIDLRWLPPLDSMPVAVYLQMIGEDEAGSLPSRLVGLAGAEYWRGFNGGSLRLHAEVADTTVEFYKNTPRFNIAYEHFIYQDGYRYRGRSIGHAMDNDSLMVALGGSWVDGDRAWSGALRRIDVNTDGREGRGAHTVSGQGEDRWELWLDNRRPLAGGLLRLGLALIYSNPASAPTQLESQVYLAWQQSWPAAHD